MHCPRRFIPLFTLLALGCGNAAPQQVVLYCAQDQEFAEATLADFQRTTGLTVTPKYDTEADKSLSLVAELQKEAGRPRCDVHWNNEIIGTIRLSRLGLLAPYASPSAVPYPPQAKAADHTWHAFAARCRVLLVNTQLVPEAERPKSLLELTQPRWKGKLAMAKPMFGTSATQAACLWEVLGAEKAKAWYVGLLDNQVQVVPGNKQAAEAVGRGSAAVAVTDTDDAMEEVAAGHPVAIVFPDAAGHPDWSRLGTLFIPNTLAVVRGCPNPTGARRLVDFLLSDEVEAKLAAAASHQIPLNPNVKVELPAQLAPAKAAKRMQVDFERAADVWDEVQAFLRKEFAR
jgi:iron(III) transport system substrate-binding protein